MLQLDEVSREMLSFFRNDDTTLLFEEEGQDNTSSLKEGDDSFDTLVSELGEQLVNVPLRVEYFRYSKSSNNQGGIVEVSGYLQDQLNFVFKFGLDEGLFITTNNFQMKDSTPEALRILYTYYNGKFQEICKKLMEAR